MSSLNFNKLLGLDYAPNAEGKDMKYVYEYNRKF